MKIVILVGGKGSRLWPMSRNQNPKQFLSLSKETFFKQTLNRCLLIEKPENIFISTNQDYFSHVKQELKNVDISENNIIVEPFRRNTGPAVLLALNKLKQEFQVDSKETILVCPSDHYITPEKKFIENIKKASRVASKGKIVTLGIKPKSPETEFGYIKIKEDNSSFEEDKVYAVEKFTEKPDSKTAQEFFDSPNYYWNSGIFLFPLNLMIQEFNQQDPELVEKINDFKNIKNTPIDKSVMEKSKQVAMVIADFSWHDVGTWKSFYQTQEKTKEGNVTIGNTLIKDVKNSLILSNNRLVAGLGLEDMVIIETEDVILISPKHRSQEVKSLVEDLEEQKDSQKQKKESEQENVRPWGKYEILETQKTYQVKKIIVKPQQRLSLQSHKHRSENWIVVQGQAKATVGKQEKTLKKGENCFIPKQTKHRLENPQKNSILEIIEIQNGNYLQEDDITRYEDDYNRE